MCTTNILSYADLVDLSGEWAWERESVNRPTHDKSEVDRLQKTNDMSEVNRPANYKPEEIFFKLIKLLSKKILRKTPLFT